LAQRSSWQAGRILLRVAANIKHTARTAVLKNNPCSDTKQRHHKNGSHDQHDV
jgi:hypothetical protein